MQYMEKYILQNMRQEKITDSWDKQYNTWQQQ
jgi:hypothetical protein